MPETSRCLSQVKIIKKMMKRKDKFDAIIIETTGMADPAPVAQTFFMDEAAATRSTASASLYW